MLLDLEDIPGDSRVVPSSTRWLVDASDRILGECRVRHRLTERLLHHGGHIGYYVRPSARRQGHGTRMLALALDEARGLGLLRVLVTCDKVNLGSAAIIRANHGVLEDEPVSRFTHQVIQRYWIAV
ncbi:MAG: GNAT family N-acetyltransferase [Armatimonadetes bacterium]|nr:GNAT family N-acetyltransferase [Armatimonadota bacterium]